MRFTRLLRACTPQHFRRQVSIAGTLSVVHFPHLPRLASQQRVESPISESFMAHRAVVAEQHDVADPGVEADAGRPDGIVVARAMRENHWEPRSDQPLLIFMDPFAAFWRVDNSRTPARLCIHTQPSAGVAEALRFANINAARADRGRQLRDECFAVEIVHVLFTVRDRAIRFDGLLSAPLLPHCKELTAHQRLALGIQSQEGRMLRQRLTQDVPHLYAAELLCGGPLSQMRCHRKSLVRLNPVDEDLARDDDLSTNGQKQIPRPK